MSDKYLIDSHKLIYHPNEVCRWYSANNSWSSLKYLFPIYIEISPIGACNHRCNFCSVDYIGYKSIKLDENILVKNIKDMALNGIKSIMFAGEGEPTLYKPLTRVLDVCSKIKIDTSLTTNFVNVSECEIENYVKNCKWIKVSINGGNEEIYSKIHNTKKSDFERVLKNIQKAKDIKELNRYSCTIGAQLLLLPDNKSSVINLAKRLSEIEIDYLVIKPYTQSLYGKSRLYDKLTYENMYNLENELNKYETEKFSVIFRINTMKKLSYKAKKYKKCYSTPNFWAYVMADGSVYTCSAFLGNEKFMIGNINNNLFSEIWQDEKRRENLDYILNELDISKCRKNCRMDNVNEYLWELLNPNEHINFI